MSNQSMKHQSYRALYRSWRPQFFSEVVGQEHVVRTLQNALAAERVAHAYLFCGLRGTGKTTMAKLLAKALNCLEGVNSEPCGRCRSCLEVMDGRNMDVLEIDAASNRGIDEIRDLRDKARYATAQNRFKVYIIDEVHMLTNEAFNALLKILEEPPPSVVFILATTEVYKLPLTVVSRCQRFDFHLLEGKQVVGRLQEVARSMDFAVEEETLYLLARQAEGSMRDALGFLEQCRAYGGEKVSYGEALEILGLTAPEVIFNLLQSVVEGDNLSGLSAIDGVVSKGKDLQRFLRETSLYLRRLVLLQSGGDEEKTLEDVPGLKPYLLRHKDIFNSHVLLEMLEILQDLTVQLKNSSQPQFLLELAFLRLVRAYRFRHYFSPEKLLSRLEELDEKLQSARAGGLSPESEEQAFGGERPAEAPPGKKVASAPVKEEEKAKAGGEAAAPPLQASEGDRNSSGNSPDEETYSPSYSYDNSISEEAHSPAGSSAKEESQGQKTEAEPEPEQPEPEQPEPEPEPEEQDLNMELNMERLQKIWDKELLPEIKKQRKHNIYALLQDCRPFSCKKGIFTVCLPTGYSFHKGRIEATRNKKYIESLLKDLLGFAVDLRVILQETQDDTGNKSKLREKKKREEDDDRPAPARPGFLKELSEAGHRDDGTGSEIKGEDDYFIREMLELFNGKLIEADGKEELNSRDFWSFSIDSTPEEPDEHEL